MFRSISRAQKNGLKLCLLQSDPLKDFISTEDETMPNASDYWIYSLLGLLINETGDIAWKVNKWGKSNEIQKHWQVPKFVLLYMHNLDNNDNSLYENFRQNKKVHIITKLFQPQPFFKHFFYHDTWLETLSDQISCYFSFCFFIKIMNNYPPFPLPPITWIRIGLEIKNCIYNTNCISLFLCVYVSSNINQFSWPDR